MSSTCRSRKFTVSASGAVPARQKKARPPRSSPGRLEVGQAQVAEFRRRHVAGGVIRIVRPAELGDDARRRQHLGGQHQGFADVGIVQPGPGQAPAQLAFGGLGQIHAAGAHAAGTIGFQALAAGGIDQHRPAHAAAPWRRAGRQGRHGLLRGRTADPGREQQLGGAAGDRSGNRRPAGCADRGAARSGPLPAGSPRPSGAGHRPGRGDVPGRGAAARGRPAATPPR